MHKRFTVATIVLAAVLTWPSGVSAQTWRFPGISNEAYAAVPPGIYAASEAQAYKNDVASQTTVK